MTTLRGCIALLAGFHYRCGEHSPISTLSPYLVRKILRSMDGDEDELAWFLRDYSEDSIVTTYPYSLVSSVVRHGILQYYLRTLYSIKRPRDIHTGEDYSILWPINPSIDAISPILTSIWGPGHIRFPSVEARMRYIIQMTDSVLIMRNFFMLEKAQTNPPGHSLIADILAFSHTIPNSGERCIHWIEAEIPLTPKAPKMLNIEVIHGGCEMRVSIDLEKVSRNDRCVRMARNAFSTYHALPIDPHRECVLSASGDPNHILSPKRETPIQHTLPLHLIPRWVILPFLDALPRVLDLE